MKPWLIALWLLACSDERPPARLALLPSEDLVVVAHQDDDLLFMQPDMFDLVTAHRPLTVVYVTAGDAQNGLPYVEGRYRALRAAYSAVVGSHDWGCAWIDVAHHTAQLCRLGAVSLVFLGYPDGGLAGDWPHSLLKLWDGSLARATTVAEHKTTYDRVGLIAALREIIATTRPHTLRTLDVAGTHGDDHADHLIVGALAAFALATSDVHADLMSYRGYNTGSEPPTTLGPLFERGSLMMRAYMACMTACGGACDETPCKAIDDPRFNAFAQRRLAIGFRRPPLTGILRTNGGCLGAGDRLVPCTEAVPVTFLPERAVRTPAGCLFGDCARQFLLDEEGHLFAEQLRNGASVAQYESCVIADAGAVRIDRCGRDRETRWTLVRPSVTTARADLELDGPLRLGDLTGDGKADLCALQRGGLWCAAGDGTGHFARATQIGRTPSDGSLPGGGAALPTEPTSLALGDVDGDGRADACALASGTLACALAAAGFTWRRWLPLGSAQSLSIVEGFVCGVSATITCVRPDVPAFMLGSPGGGSPLFGALDRDGLPDWCVVGESGPACALARERTLTAEAMPWGYAQGGTFQATTGAAALGDVDGDGRADLCAVVGDTVQCAIAKDHGFGPRSVWLDAPGATALWLGDLEGDGKADPCVDTAPAIVCAPSP